ncbi:unnamed protein product, partial [Symbiodinium sp. KB8]
PLAFDHDHSAMYEPAAASSSAHPADSLDFEADGSPPAPDVDLPDLLRRFRNLDLRVRVLEAERSGGCYSHSPRGHCCSPSACMGVREPLLLWTETISLHSLFCCTFGVPAHEALKNWLKTLSPEQRQLLSQAQQMGAVPSATSPTDPEPTAQQEVPLPTQANPATVPIPEEDARMGIGMAFLTSVTSCADAAFEGQVRWPLVALFNFRWLGDPLLRLLKELLRQGTQLYRAIEDLSLEVRRQGLLLNRVVSALERLDPDFDFGRVSFVRGYCEEEGAMSEASEDSEASRPDRPLELGYVYTGGATNFNFSVGALAVGEESKTVAIALITDYEDRVVVALPSKAWDKRVKHRKVSSPFARPSLVQVLAAAPDDREQPADASVKVWIGLLARQVAAAVVFGGPPEECDVPFLSLESSPCLPFAAALVQVADAQFGFATARSGADASQEARLKAIEASLEKLSRTVSAAVGDGAPATKVPAPPKRGAKAKTKAGRPPESVPGTPLPRGAAREVPGLDPAVVRAALDAGIKTGELEELRSLLGEKRSALRDFPPRRNELDDADGCLGQGRRLQYWCGGCLEFVFRRILKETVKSDPAQVYGAIERLLEEDLLHRQLGAGLADARASSRGWLEHRSHLSLYPTTVRLLWAVTGIWDCLRAGRHEEARARAALTVAAADQQALDGGNTQYESVDSYHSRIFEPRWAELCLHRVRELEQHLEAKKKLGGKGRPAPPSGADSQGDPKADKPERPGGKGAKGPSGGVSRNEFLTVCSFCVLGASMGRPDGCSRGACFYSGPFGPVALLGRFSAALPRSAPSALLCLKYSLTPTASARAWARIAQAVDMWNRQPPVTAGDMGRTAVKVEKVEAQVRALAVVDPSARCSSLPDLNLAKDVEVSRVSLPKSPPTFDPAPFLDKDLRSLYLNPSLHSIRLEDAPAPPPRVSFRCSSKAARMDLLSSLDASGRLRLFRGDLRDHRTACGLFAIPKSTEADRLIVDARPSNLVMDSDMSWLGTMGAASALLRFELEDSEQLYLSGEDIRDFYHQFLVTEDRSAHYRLVGFYPPASLQHLSCFTADLMQAPCVVAALNCVAMGDVNAVSIGQSSHIGLVLSTELVSFEQLVCLRNPPPRQPLGLGVIIDDLIVIEKAARGEDFDPQSCHSPRVVARMHEVYSSVRLPRHEKKGFFMESRASFWGADVLGDLGLVRPAWSRLSPLVSLTLAVLELPALSVSLLEILAGSWVSVLSFRRRALCLLDQVYMLQRGRSRFDLVENTVALRVELFSLCALAPLIRTDLRAKSNGLIVASDASDDLRAYVTCRVAPSLTRELLRHVPTKGLWARLLSPSESLLKRRGFLPPESELPGQVYRTSPLWTQLAQALAFRLGAVFRRRRSDHINLKEMDSYLAVEAALGFRDWESSRSLALLDSQVCLGSLLKGRSASFSINRRLRSALGGLLFFNLHPSCAYVASADNPADDPTRLAPLRLPAIPVQGFDSLAEKFAPQPLDLGLALVPFCTAVLADSVAKAAVKVGFPWSLTFDWLHGARQDLLDPRLQGAPPSVRLFALLFEAWITLVAFPTPCELLFPLRLVWGSLSGWKILKVSGSLTAVLGASGGCADHLVLRGRVAGTLLNWTKAAESLPQRACEELARALWTDVARPGSSVSSCVRDDAARIGEAKVPGPRQPRRARTGSLFDVELVDPRTISLRARVWEASVGWLRERLSSEATLALFSCPPLLALVLRDYADELYKTGASLGSYRQLLAHGQKLLPLLRPHLKPAWEMVSRWEELQPICHRTPMPEIVSKAMCGLALALGWRRWAAATAGIFYAIMRPVKAFQLWNTICRRCRLFRFFLPWTRLPDGGYLLLLFFFRQLFLATWAVEGALRGLVLANGLIAPSGRDF